MSIQRAILSFYTELLGSLNITPANPPDGALSFSLGGTDPVPLLIGRVPSDPNSGKQLVLPTEHNLGKVADGTFVYFHPLSENVARGDSDVINWLKNAMTLAINAAVSEIGTTLINVGANPDLALKLTGEQVEIACQLSGGESIKDKLAVKLRKLLVASSDNANVSLVSIYLKRDAKQYGSEKVWQRAAKVSFPLISEINKKHIQGDTNIMGIDFAKYEVKILCNLFNILFPDNTETDYYSVFDNPINSPSFVVLVNAFAKIAARLAKVRRTFANHMIENGSKINADWLPTVSDIPRFVGVIPNLEGNQGSVPPSDVSSDWHPEHTAPERSSAVVDTQQMVKTFAEKPVVATAALRPVNQQEEEIRHRQLSREYGVGDGNDLRRSLTGGGGVGYRSREERRRSEGRGRSSGRDRGRYRDDYDDRDYDRDYDRDDRGYRSRHRDDDEDDRDTRRLFSPSRGRGRSSGRDDRDYDRGGRSRNTARL